MITACCRLLAGRRRADISSRAACLPCAGSRQGEPGHLRQQRNEQASGRRHATSSGVEGGSSIVSGDAGSEGSGVGLVGASRASSPPGLAVAVPKRELSIVAHDVLASASHTDTAKCAPCRKVWVVLQSVVLSRCNRGSCLRCVQGPAASAASAAAPAEPDGQSEKPGKKEKKPKKEKQPVRFCSQSALHLPVQHTVSLEWQSPHPMVKRCYGVLVCCGHH